MDAFRASALNLLWICHRDATTWSRTRSLEESEAVTRGWKLLSTVGGIHWGSEAAACLTEAVGLTCLLARCYSSQGRCSGRQRFPALAGSPERVAAGGCAALEGSVFPDLPGMAGGWSVDG